MSTQTVVGSKPNQIPVVKAAWRKSAEQLRAQTWRFIRLFVATLVPQILGLIASGQSVSGNSLRTVIISIVVPTAEVVWRQLHPALTVAAVDSAPGATIIQEEPDVSATFEAPMPPPADITPADTPSDMPVDPAVDTTPDVVDTTTPVGDAASAPAPAKSPRKKS